MASVGLGTYVVVVLPVGGSKAFDIKLVLHRESRTGKTWFLAGSNLPNEEHVDVAVRELLKETDLTLTVDDLTLFISNHVVRVSLRGWKRQVVCVFSAFVPVPYVTTNLQTPTNVEQVDRA
jgi:ADP-ribose pyrophosphatase YjhB (NUDIX family)